MPNLSTRTTQTTISADSWFYGTDNAFASEFKIERQNIFGQDLTLADGPQFIGVTLEEIAGLGNVTLLPDASGNFTVTTAGPGTNISLIPQTSVAVGAAAGGSLFSVAGGCSFGATYYALAAPTNGFIVEGGAGFGTPLPTGFLEIAGMTTISRSGTPNQRIIIDANANENEISSLSVESNKKPLEFYSLDDESGTPSGENPFIWYTGTPTTSVERMRLTQAGLVGINTGSPDTLLTINTPGSFSGNLVKFRSSTDSSDYNVTIGASTSAALVYYTFNLVNNGIAYDHNLVIDRGTVGISLLPAAYRGNLVVSAESTGGISIISENTTFSASLYFGDGTSGADNSKGQLSYNHNTDTMTLVTANADRMALNSAFVGLGTGTAPTGTTGKVLMFGDNAGNPTPGTNTAGLFAKDVSGTVEMFAVNEAGVVHPMTGSGASGSYTPTFTNISNTDDTTEIFDNTFYQVIGNIVSVTGSLIVELSSSVTTWGFALSLPVASNMTAPEDLVGVANAFVFGSPTNRTPVSVIGIDTSDTASFTGEGLNSASSGTIVVSYEYKYEIK